MGTRQTETDTNGLICLFPSISLNCYLTIVFAIIILLRVMKYDIVFIIREGPLEFLTDKNRNKGETSCVQ